MSVHKCERALLCSWHSTHEEIRGLLAEVSSLLPLCGFWELKSGRQTWQQVPFPTESSCQLDRRDFWTDRNPDSGWAVLYKDKRIVLSLFGSASRRLWFLGQESQRLWDGWCGSSGPGLEPLEPCIVIEHCRYMTLCWKIPSLSNEDLLTYCVLLQPLDIDGTSMSVIHQAAEHACVHTGVCQSITRKPLDVLMSS